MCLLQCVGCLLGSHLCVTHQLPSSIIELLMVILFLYCRSRNPGFPGLSLQAASRILRLPILCRGLIINPIYYNQSASRVVYPDAEYKPSLLLMNNHHCNKQFYSILTSLHPCYLSGVLQHSYNYFPVMKTPLLLSVLLVFSLSFNLVSLNDEQSCAEATADIYQQVADLPERLDVTPKVYSQKVFAIVRAVPNALDECNLPEVHEQFDYYLPNACINELQDILTLADQYDRATNNITKTLYLTQLTARLTVTFPLKCPNLYEVVKHFINRTNLLETTEITQKCGESMYNTSLLVEKVIRDIASNKKFGEDLVNAITKLPDTVEECGNKQLADELRRDLPQECLESFNTLANTIESFLFNHSHLEWVWTHRKDLFKSINQIRFTCPLF